jgi:hypothetical protein
MDFCCKIKTYQFLIDREIIDNNLNKIYHINKNKTKYQHFNLPIFVDKLK